VFFVAEEVRAVLPKWTEVPASYREHRRRLDDHEHIGVVDEPRRPSPRVDPYQHEERDRYREQPAPPEVEQRGHEVLPPPPPSPRTDDDGERWFNQHAFDIHRAANDIRKHSQSVYSR